MSASAPPGSSVGRPVRRKNRPRQNVDFFATPSEALLGGYRPCLRCTPMDPEQRPPKLVEQLRAEVERAPGGRLTDKELAAMQIDPSTARRQFQRHYGMTFQAYHRARRMGLALREVRKGSRVDEAQTESGFESASGFREAFNRIFGESPTAAKERPASSRNDSKRRSARWSRSRMTKACACSSLRNAARSSARSGFCASASAPASCRGSIVISSGSGRS